MSGAPLELHLVLPAAVPLDARVPAELRLVNRGDASLVVNGRLLVAPASTPEPFHEVTFEIRGPDGYVNRRLLEVNAGEPSAEHFVDLSPGENLRREADLTEFESLHVPGRYDVRATYSNHVGGDRLVRRPWVGTVASEWACVERR